MLFCLKYEPVEDIINCLPDEWTMNHELPIYPVKYRLQIFPLPRILRVKEIKKPDNETVINVSLGQLRICLRRLNES
uniref:Uncharacterized protein n=1 Tax=Arundo donax TaxID=35708 RepID=A0A0A8YBY2_ARUDO